MQSNDQDPNTEREIGSNVDVRRAVKGPEKEPETDEHATSGATAPKKASKQALLGTSLDVSRKRKKRVKKIAVSIGLILALLVAGAVFAFPRLDSYLLDRAEKAEQERERIAAQELEEDEFEPIAERVIEDVRSNIYRPRTSSSATSHESGATSQTTSERSSVNEVATSASDGSSASVSIHQEINAQSSSEVTSTSAGDDDLELDPFGLLFLMREAVIAYDDAGEYAREGRYNTAHSYLSEADLLFTELIVIIDEGAHTLSSEHQQGATHLRQSAVHFRTATRGAQQFVRGIEPSVDIAAEDARARAALREARTLLEV